VVVLSWCSRPDFLITGGKVTTRSNTLPSRNLCHDYLTTGNAEPALMKPADWAVATPNARPKAQADGLEAIQSS